MTVTKTAYYSTTSRTSACTWTLTTGRQSSSHSSSWSNPAGWRGCRSNWTNCLCQWLCSTQAWWFQACRCNGNPTLARRRLRKYTAITSPRTMKCRWSIWARPRGCWNPSRSSTPPCTWGSRMTWLTWMTGSLVIPTVWRSSSIFRVCSNSLRLWRDLQSRIKNGKRKLTWRTGLRWTATSSWKTKSSSTWMKSVTSVQSQLSPMT